VVQAALEVVQVTDFDRIEALVGPLEKGREYLLQSSGEAGEGLTGYLKDYADAALAEAYAVLERLDSKRALRAEILDSAWNTAHERAERAERRVEAMRGTIDSQTAIINADAGCKARAEKAEAENERLKKFLGSGYVRNCIIEGGSEGDMFVFNDAGIVPKLDGFLIRKLDRPSPAVLVQDLARRVEENSCP
jgi:hypothetical protein